jgi:optic atrophy 3 protein
MAIFVFKVVTLIVRTVAKPLIQWVTYYNKLKLQEQRSNLAFIKDRIIWTGQVVNYYNVKINRQLFRLSKTEPIKPLSEDKAIEKGAEFLSEFLVYSILITLPIYEYLRQNKINKQTEYLKEQEIRRMKNDINALTAQNQNLIENINELKSLLIELNKKI